MSQEEDPKLLIKGNSLRRGFKAFAERTSIEYRKQLGLSGHNHLCAFDLSEYLNVGIFTPADFLLSSFEIDHLLNGGFSALTMKTVSGQQIIIHNNLHAEGRQQSNIMHEIAHIICSHPLEVNGTELPILRNYNKEHEHEASWLGSCLQLPRLALTWAMHKGMSLDDMCNYYKVSKSMLQYRINITGVLRQFR